MCTPQYCLCSVYHDVIVLFVIERIHHCILYAHQKSRCPVKQLTTSVGCIDPKYVHVVDSISSTIFSNNTHHFVCMVSFLRHHLIVCKCCPYLDIFVTSPHDFPCAACAAQFYLGKFDTIRSSSQSWNSLLKKPRCDLSFLTLVSLKSW